MIPMLQMRRSDFPRSEEIVLAVIGFNDGLRALRVRFGASLRVTGISSHFLNMKIRLAIVKPTPTP